MASPDKWLKAIRKDMSDSDRERLEDADAKAPSSRAALIDRWRHQEERAEVAENELRRAEAALAEAEGAEEWELVEMKANLGVVRLVAQNERRNADVAKRNATGSDADQKELGWHRKNLKKRQETFARAGKSMPAEIDEAQSFSLAEFQGKPVPERKWIVEGLIPDRNVTLLAGDGGTGKSLLAIQLLVGVACTGLWIGEGVQKGVALYFSAEDEKDEIQRRADSICRAENIKFSDLTNFHVLPYAGRDAILAGFDRKTGAMVKTQVWDSFVRKIEELRPRVVVLATLADVFCGSEIERGQARSFISALRGLALEYDCAFVVLAHPSVSGMADGTGRSGSTGWANSVRSRLFFQHDDKDSDLRKLTSNKSNYSRRGTEFYVRWDDGVFIRQASANDAEAMKAAEDKFMELLAERIGQNRPVSD
jgi:hypothetical protein